MSDDDATETGPDDRMPSTAGVGLPYWFRRVGIFSWLLLGVVAAVGVVAVLFALTSAFIIPIVIAVFLAVVFAPVVTWLTQHGLAPSLAALTVLVGLGLSAVLVVFVTGAALVDQADELTENLGQAVDDIRAWLSDTPISGQLADQVSQTTADAGPTLASGLAGGAVSVLGSATAFVSGLVLALIVLYYLLKDGLTSATGRRESDDERDATVGRITADAITDIQGYFRGQTAIAVMNGAIVAIAALVLGVPAAAAIGVVNFFGAYVPYLGAFVGGAFAVLMGLGAGGLGLAVAMLLVCVGVNLVLENLLQPILIGGSLDIGPLPILLATTLGGMVAGMIGLVLAAPLLAIALDARRELRAAGFFDEPAATE